MKFSRSCLLTLPLILLIKSASGQSLLASLFSENSEITIDKNASLTCKNSITECVDCTSARICQPDGSNLIQIATVSCVKDSSTPYCDPSTGLCGSVPPPGCGPSKFICPKTNGIYPDPSNCAIYHICVNGFDVPNTCPTNNVYDHEKGQCKLRRRGADCVTINCNRKNGQNVVYPADDRIWGKCIGENAFILDRCKDYERFDVASGKCVRTCRGVGNQPPLDPTECQRYVYCAEVSHGKYVSTNMSCACNEGYDEKLNACSSEATCVKQIATTCKPPTLSSVNGVGGTSTLIMKIRSLNEDVGDSHVIDKREAQVVAPLIINNSGDGNNDNKVSNGNDDVDGNLVNGNGNGDNQNSGNVQDPAVAPLIINNSGSGNKNNNVSNGNDDVDGNLVNGNGNGDNQNSGNVQKKAVAPLIINNSGDRNNNNKIANGDDDVDGNLVNGNSNGDNKNSGNVQNPAAVPLIINNSGSGNNNNKVSNGDDDVNGNLVNGNSNGNNTNSGNVQNPAVAPLIINNSGNENNNNNVSNDNDDVDGNLVNGNGNGDNQNSGNVQNPAAAPLIINNSGNNNTNTSVSNGNDDVNGNMVNGNGNGSNDNSGNVNGTSSTNRTKRSETTIPTVSEITSTQNPKIPDGERHNSWLGRIIRWIRNVLGI